MQIIFEFLDPPALARMAQVSRGWRDIVYRDNVWLGFEYRIRTDAASLFLSAVPPNAHHIGEPTHYCFIGWIMQNPALPTSISCITDRKAYMQAAWAHWVQLNKPCRKINHHCASDVMAAGEYLKTLDKRDRQRISLRSLAPLLVETKHAYAAWLEAQKSSIGWLRRIPARPTPLTEAELADPFCKLKYQTELLSYEHSAALSDYVIRANAKMDQSLRALACLGKSVFDTNERRLKSDQTGKWDAVAFTWEPSDLLQTEHALPTV